MNPPLENNPIRHVQKIKAQMLQLISQLGEAAGKATPTNARALFESSAEVLGGLVKAYDDFEANGQKAWLSEFLASLPSRGASPRPAAIIPVTLTNQRVRRHLSRPAAGGKVLKQSGYTP